MARLRTNLLANFAGAGWSAAAQIACVPLFIELLGMEAYGLIGFFVTLQVTLRVLDLGVSATVSRELARYSALPDKAAEARNFLWTLEVGYWAVGATTCVAVAVLAPVLATHWLTTSSLSTSTTRQAIELMGLVIGLQLPLGFYQGALMGLQRLVALNVFRIAAASINLGGAVLVLWLVSRTVQAFFVWQALGSLANTILIAAILRRNAPAAAVRPRLDMQLLRGALPFAKGMSGVVVLGTILSQMDKIVLSKFLTLTEFGYYTAAGMVAGALQLFITPIFSAVFPRLSALVMKDDVAPIVKLYHAGAQLMAVCVLPTAIVLAMWAPQAIELWTGNHDVAAKVAPLAALLLAGTAINGLMNLPYALQLAYGWTTLNLRFSLCAIVAFAPLLVVGAIRYGAVGGAATWLLLNLCYLAVVPTLMHRRLLPDEMRNWIWRDIACPFVGAVVIASIGRELLDSTATGVVAILQLGCVGLAVFGTATLLAPEIRSAVITWRVRSRSLLDV